MSLLKTGHERIEHDSGCANAYHPMFVHAHVLFFTHGKLCSSAEVAPLFSEREPKITEKSLLVNRQFLLLTIHNLCSMYQIRCIKAIHAYKTCPLFRVRGRERIRCI